MKTGLKIAIVVMALVALAWGAMWRLEAKETSRWQSYPYPILANSDLELPKKVVEERLKRMPDSALEMTAYASLLAQEAQRTGETELFDQAEKYAKRSLKSLPFSNEGALLILAEVAESRHQFDLAMQRANEVLKTKPRNDGALSILVTCSLGKGELAKALEYAEKLASTKPSVASYTMRALVRLAMGRDEEALTDFEQALSREDLGEAQGSSWTRALLGRYYVSRGKLNVAESVLKEAIRLNPKNHLAIRLMAEVEVKRERYAAAESYYTEAYNMSGEPPYILAHAHLKEKLGDRESAEKMRIEAEKNIRDEFASGPYGHPSELVEVLLDRGGKERVAEALSVAKKDYHHRRDAKTLFNLARAFFAAGELQAAKGVMAELLSSGVKDRLYREYADMIEKALGNPIGDRTTVVQDTTFPGVASVDGIPYPVRERGETERETIRTLARLLELEPVVVAESLPTAADEAPEVITGISVGVTADLSDLETAEESRVISFGIQTAVADGLSMGFNYNVETETIDDVVDPGAHLPLFSISANF